MSKLITLGAVILLAGCDIQTAQQPRKPRFWHAFVFRTCVEDMVSVGATQKNAEKSCMNEWRWCIREGYCNQ